MPVGIGQKLVVVFAGIVFRIEKVLYIPKHHPEGSLGVKDREKKQKKQLSDLAKINQLLNEYDGKMSVYAVCSTDFVHSIAGFINTNTALSDTKINFVNDVRAEGADTDTYYKLIGGSGADRRIMIINKDGKVAYSTDAAYDYDTIKAELDKLFAN